MIYTGAVILIAFALSPFIWMVVLSFAGNATFLFNGDYGFTFNNYVRIITEQQYHFPEYMRNSLIVSIVVSIFVTIFSSFAGYAVSRMRFPRQSGDSAFSAGDVDVSADQYCRVHQDRVQRMGFGTTSLSR